MNVEINVDVQKNESRNVILSVTVDVSKGFSSTIRKASGFKNEIKLKDTTVINLRPIFQINFTIIFRPEYN